MIVISSSWMDPLTIQWYPSLSFLMALILKSLLSDMSTATPAFLSCPLAWNLFSHPSLSICKCPLPQGECMVGSRLKDFAFLSQSATLCLLIGAFSPLTFQVIIDRYVFISILSLIFQLILCFSFLLFFSFFFWLDGFHLFYACILFSFCECNVWFWFVVALFLKYANPFI